MKSNEVKILSIFIIAALICGVVGYNAFYQIKPNVNVLTEYIADIYSRGRDEQQSPEVSVYDNIEIGKASYYMLEINQELGIAKFRTLISHTVSLKKTEENIFCSAHAIHPLRLPKFPL